MGVTFDQKGLRKFFLGGEKYENTDFKVRILTMNV